MAVIVPPAGVTPMGQFPGGVYAGQPPPPTIRADKIDPITQEFASFVKDDDPIDSQVIGSLWRVRLSGAAVADTGARFLDVSKLTDSAIGNITGEARYAMRRMLQRGDISLKSLTVETGSDWAELVCNYVNNRTLTSNKNRQVRVRLPEGALNGTL